MAVVAVGDFKKADIEFQIRAHFGSIPALSSPRPRPTFTVPDQQGTALDRHRPRGHQHLRQRDEHDGGLEQVTIGAYRQHGVEQLFAAMLSARLDISLQAPMRRFCGRRPIATSSCAPSK